MSAVVEAYDFGNEFQTLLIGYLFRDAAFNLYTDGLIKPQYFGSEVFSVLADISISYFNKYKGVPSRASVELLLKEAIDSKKIKPELKSEVLEVLKAAYKEELKDVDYVIDQIVAFAKKQELTFAILKSAELIDKGDFGPVEGLIKTAVAVGKNDATEQYDFWEEADARLKTRHDIIAGLIKPTGVTTGHKEIDEALYNKGWGRSELSVLMGPAKSGKSMALVGFAMNAARAGHNVLYVSLEVSKRIIADRLEANLSGIKMNDLAMEMKKARDATTLGRIKSGHLKIHDYASGTFKPSDLKRLIHKYEASGIKFDLVIVDYADLMAPDHRYNEPRDNIKSVYIDLRAVAYEFDCAVLSATQTNRNGFKADVGKMEDVAEDINKVRTVDLMISLNRDEYDVANDQARLYFAASRNQESVLIKVKSDIGTSRYVKSVLEVIKKDGK